MSFFRGTRDPKLEALRREVAELRQLLATRDVAPSAEQAPTATTVTKTTPVSTRSAGEAVSRRGLLRALPAAAAVGVVGAVGSSLLQETPAVAADGGTPLLLGRYNYAGLSTTHLSSGNESSVLMIGYPQDDGVFTAFNPAQLALSDTIAGASYLSVESVNIYYDQPSKPQTHKAYFRVELDPDTASTVGFVRIDGPTYTAATPSHSGADALHVTAVGSGTAITASVSGGVSEENLQLTGVALHVTADKDSAGVVVNVQSGPAMRVNMTDNASMVDGIAVANSGLGRAMVVTNSSTSNTVGAITGISNGTSAGVWGATTGSNSGPAVVGWATSTGRGGRFKGGAAAINLAPGTSTSHPSSGMLGDLVVDSTSRLWFCKGGMNWHQLA